MTELIDRCEDERKRALKRERQRAYQREYAQRPEVKAKRRDYKKRQATQNWHREYYKRPEVRDRKRVFAVAYYRKPANQERVRARRLKREFGITVEQYDAMLALQNGGCALCGRPPKKRRLAVEHDHATGRVRGLACHRCNKYVIGQNTVDSVQRLLAYLSSDFDGRKLVA